MLYNDTGCDMTDEVIKGICDIMIDYPAVSYTHLDVYKRQLRSRQETASSMAEVIFTHWES